MRPVAPEEQAALGAQANDRTRTHRLAVGAYVDHRARLDRVIAEVVLLIARTAECVLAFLIVALVEHEECFGHLRSLYPGPIRQPEDLPHSEFYFPTARLSLQFVLMDRHFAYRRSEERRLGK